MQKRKTIQIPSIEVHRMLKRIGSEPRISGKQSCIILDYMIL